MGLEKTSAFIFAIGMAAFVMMIGSSLLDLMPFAFESVEKLVFILFLVAVILAVEVFKEEKIRSLKGLTNKPFAMLETLFIVVIVVVNFILLSSGGVIPEAMKATVGVICLLAGAMIVMEMKH